MFSSDRYGGESAEGIDESNELDDPSSVSRRAVSGLLDNHRIEKRAEKKIETYSGGLTIISPITIPLVRLFRNRREPKIYGYKNPDLCDDYDFALVGIPTDTSKYATKHILGFQLLKIFLETKSRVDGDKWKRPKGGPVNLCAYMIDYWAGNIILKVDGEEGTPMELLPKVFPGRDNSFASVFVVLEKYVEETKERVSSLCLQLPRCWRYT